MSFIGFLRRNLAAARLAIQTQIEYRIDFLIDALIQPVATAAIEVTLWYAILSSLPEKTLGGFGREYYLVYALWANFVGRVTTNWWYEWQMLDSIETGKVNSLLVRPISFYEYYLSQFIGYKLLIAGVSFVIPLTVTWYFGGPFHFDRFPVVMALILYYLVFVHTLSFCVACIAFFLNRATSFTGIKNMAIWVFAGELVPLDLYPEPFKQWLISSPFACGVFIPVGYLTGRIDHQTFYSSFLSISLGIAVTALLAAWMWRQGVRSYTGTGA